MVIKQVDLSCICFLLHFFFFFTFFQVTLYHLLKLFQSDSSAMPKKTVVSEFYDEMVRNCVDMLLINVDRYTDTDFIISFIVLCHISVIHASNYSIHTITCSKFPKGSIQILP